MAINKLFKNFSDGNKLNKFFNDKEKVTTQFKALHSYGGSVSLDDRKAFHQKNYRRAFSVCRNALDEYAKRGANTSRKKEAEDIKRPCEIMDALTRLCQDIPHLVKQNWNHNALSELFTKFLNFNTNQEIRLKCITFLFVVINAAKDQSHKKYIDCLKYSADYTPFCIQLPYENYYNNFKKNLIVAQEPLPWIRTGPTNKPHCMDILSTLLQLVEKANDFEFWYLYINKHIYSQLYYSCTCNNNTLVDKLFSDDQKHESDNINNIEKEGFGSVGPPPLIQSLITKWCCNLLNNSQKNRIILSKKIYILYILEIMKHSMTLPVKEYTMEVYNVLIRIEKWILGVGLSNVFKDEIQFYYQIIIKYLFKLFEINVNEMTSKKIHKKINLIGYGIYLLRLISGEPYIKLKSETWQILINGIINQIKYFQNNKTFTLIKQKQLLTLITEKIVHPLVHCLFKSFVLVSITNVKCANVLLTEFKFEIKNLIKYEPFVIQWREIIRNMTIELLLIISPKEKEKEKNYRFDISNNKHNKANYIPNQNLEMSNDSYYFNIENRLQKLNIDVFEFEGLDKGFMIYDRLLHLLGSPNDNQYMTRYVHLEGFCDSLKIFISALGIKERGMARIKKDMALRKMREKMKGVSGHNESKENDMDDGYKDNKVNHKGDDGVRRMGQSVYGFPHSLISVPIDVSNIALTGNLPESMRRNLPLPPREQLPQGDTLMEIFGPWLFDICINILCNCTLTEQVNRLNEFRMSFGCLCYIFLTHCEIAFDDLYLCNFYKIIQLSFDNKISSKIRSIVISECNKGCIFGKNLNGVNCLIPYFLDGMIKIVGYNEKHKKHQIQQSKQTNNHLKEQETNDILNICMSLICFSSHFNKIEIINPNNKKPFYFSQIKQQISDVFSYISHFDNLPINIINTIIWSNVLIIYDEVVSTKNVKIIQQCLKSIVDGTNINKLSMAYIATSAIDSLSPICKQICEIDENLIIKYLFQPFLNNTIEFVSKAGNRDLTTWRDICKISTHQIYCSLEWMFRFPPNILCNNELMSLYFRVIHLTLCLSTKLPNRKSLHQNVNDKYPLADVVLAGQTSKMMLFHYLCNFPLSHDSGAISSNASDDYKGSQEGNVFLSYDNNVLITANDRILAHQAGPEPGVRLLLRDESGKFAWNFTPCSIQAKPINNNTGFMILPKSNKNNNSNDNSVDEEKEIDSKPKLDKRRPPLQSPPPSINKNNKSKSESDDFINDNLLGPLAKEKHANIDNKKEFKYLTNSTTKVDGLKQVLNYVTRELTPPLGKSKQSEEDKKPIINIKTIDNNKGSFPSGHLSDKSRIKLKKYMNEQKQEEYLLYKQYQNNRQIQMNKLKKLQAELAKEEEKKEDGGIKHLLNDMKIREAVTGFDCSRFLLGHFGILTPGHVLGVKDSFFSDITSDDINKNIHQKAKKKPTSPPTRKMHHHMHMNYTRNTSASQPHVRQHMKRSSGKQYRLDPYLYSLDQNLLAMFGNKDNAFNRRLRLLDQSSFEREKHKIGVVYVGPDQDEQKYILANENSSNNNNITLSISYQRFINNLGWTIDLLRHQGFNGAMNASTTGRYAKYYNTATYEMAFHIATNMPTNYNDPQQTEKKKHIGNDQVNIIWTDHSREYIIDTIYSHFNQVQIVIYPLNNGLFRIKIHKKQEVGSFGILLNNMIITQHLLSILVRITSLYANRTVRYATRVYTRPFVERKKYLDEAIEKNSHKSHESILGAFFPYMASQSK